MTTWEKVQAIVEQIKNTEGITHEMFAVHQKPDEFNAYLEWLQTLNREFQYGLDIGIAAGLTTKVVRDFVQINKTIIVDNNLYPEIKEFWPIVKKYLNSELIEIWGDSKNELIKNQLRRYKGEIDYIFIDGEHSPEAVYSDALLAHEIGTGDCLIIFHDVHAAFDGVRIGFEKVMETGKFKVIQDFKNPEGHPHGSYGITVCEKA